MKKFIKNKAVLQTGIALVSMIAVAVVILIPTTLANPSNADSINNSSASVSSVSNSGNSTVTTNTNVNTNDTSGATCTTGCYPPVTVYCQASATSINLGTLVTYTAYPTGGTGYYTFSWSDNQGPFQSQSNKVIVNYSTPGYKTVTIRVNSDGDIATANCSTTVVNNDANPPPTPCGCTNPPVTVYCQANVSSANVGDVVTYTAYPTGGTGYYTFSWSDNQGPFQSQSNKVLVKYSTAGYKTVTIRVNSDGDIETANCSTTVNQPVVPITVICTPSSNTVNVGDSVTYTATVSGGDGNYSYSWNGSNGLYGSNSSVSDSYSTSGSKTATVTVTDNGQSLSATCNVTVNTVAVPISVVCDASANVVNTGSSVTFTANASGGDGNYTYSWNGTNGVSGSGSSITHTYTGSGTNSVTVTVTDEGQSISATCNVTVNINVVPNNLAVTCYANPSTVNVGNTITWIANATGGDGNYSYSWNGSNGLYGNSSNASQVYYNTGSQYATVTVTDNGQTISATCNATVNQNYVPPVYNYNNLNVYCQANPSTINVGQPMTWTAYATGGNGGYYTYSWSGSNGFYGNNNYNNYNGNYNNNTNSSVTYTYNTPGTVTATVTVYSNGQTVSANCTGYVQGQQQYIQPIVSVTPTTPVNPSSGVYLSAIPATGISSNMKTDLFIGGMFIWSSFMAYIFLSRRNSKLAAAALMDGAYAEANPIAAESLGETEAAPLSFSEKIADAARAQNILLSHDAMRVIAERAGGDETTAGTLIASIKAAVGNNEGWTTVNKSKLEEVLG